MLDKMKRIMVVDGSEVARTIIARILDTSMKDAEVNSILNRVEEGIEAPRTMIHFDIGEKVNVTDGPFEGFDGMVEEVDDDNQRLKVTVSIFGRATPVELEYTQVAKQA